MAPPDRQLLKAHHLYKLDVNYVVEKGEVVIVDEFTGRKMEGRQWSDGLHQAVQAKEGLKIKAESQTLATITLQNFFKLYKKLGGMTGTAMTEASEFGRLWIGCGCRPNQPRDATHQSSRQNLSHRKREMGRGCQRNSRSSRHGTTGSCRYDFDRKIGIDRQQAHQIRD